MMDLVPRVAVLGWSGRLSVPPGNLDIMPPIPQIPGDARPCADELNERIRALLDDGRALNAGQREELARLTEAWCDADRWRRSGVHGAVLAA